MNALSESIRPTDVRSVYPGANPLALDLISKLLDFNPSTRMTADEALRHPYIQVITQLTQSLLASLLATYTHILTLLQL